MDEDRIPYEYCWLERENIEISSWFNEFSLDTETYIKDLKTEQILNVFSSTTSIFALNQRNRNTIICMITESSSDVGHIF